MKDNSLMKLIGILLLAVLGLWLVQAIISGTGFGIGVGIRGNFGGEHMYMGTGFGYGGTIAYLLLLMTKVLFAVFVVAVVAGIIVWIKNNLFTAEETEAIKNTFVGSKKASQKELCVICSKELNPEWKLCPHCGKEKEVKNA
ncbi:hypothetical protein [Thermotalea metallivorans]|uniref:Zinc-ribbon domain-containing protein n=1 Tax=Thermotalea metallivorans TaxID=520762 RepID=A0A140L068_9FIRM|nr:hypothetical protein [Thermotalea metallivorans]KXG73943.1 hypothetical protein AN619_27520 [Thermotalea metallivorans]